jgi:hypothetical protein
MLCTVMLRFEINYLKATGIWFFFSHKFYEIFCRYKIQVLATVSSRQISFKQGDFLDFLVL